jgi:hypothetical protein
MISFEMGGCEMGRGLPERLWLWRLTLVIGIVLSDKIEWALLVANIPPLVELVATEKPEWSLIFDRNWVVVGELDLDDVGLGGGAKADSSSSSSSRCRRIRERFALILLY